MSPAWYVLPYVYFQCLCEVDELIANQGVPAWFNKKKMTFARNLEQGDSCFDNIFIKYLLTSSQSRASYSISHLAHSKTNASFRI